LLATFARETATPHQVCGSGVVSCARLTAGAITALGQNLDTLSTDTGVALRRAVWRLLGETFPFHYSNKGGMSGIKHQFLIVFNEVIK